MQTLASYTNRKGEKFTVLFEEPPVPDTANYWGFFYRVADSKKRHRTFRLVIKKSFIADHRLALNFGQGLPLEALHGLLEFVEDGSLPLFIPDASKGWEVF
jgi:hypothetical protein